MSRKKWLVSAVDKELAFDLAEESDIDPFAALLLVSRGMTDEDEIAEFFSDSVSLISPYEIKDMDKAVARIQKAIDGKEKIAVYGDYDADGVTATALLHRFFTREGVDVITYIPDRNTEGYGLNKKAIEKLYNMGVKLIVTVDNGISAIEEAEYIYSLGMELVVTDHHKGSLSEPRAEAIVDPHRVSCPSSYKSWAGVGVAFKLVCALSDEDDETMLRNYSDLVTVGTIGDIVSLTGENRLIVKHGLRQLNKDTCLGLSRLKKASGYEEKQLTATSVAFSLVPRLNSVGRMNLAKNALELLVSNDSERVEEICRNVDFSNSQRQEIEKQITLQAQKQIEENPSMLFDRVLVFSGKDWHGGVIGIVASRLVSKYGKPCIVITEEGEEAKGSGRSIEGFSLYDAICSASHLLTHYGGHVLAAGFGLHSDKIEQFRKTVNDYAKTVEMPFPVIEIDCRLKPELISSDILPVISSLEPFGAGNPQPLFGLFGMTLVSVSSLSGGKHQRLTLRKGDTTVTALYFNVSDSEFPYKAGDVLDLAVRLERNEYMGQVRVSIYVKDIRMSGTDDDKYLRSVRLYEKIRRGEKISLSAVKQVFPERQIVADVYRFIRSVGQWTYDTDVLAYRLGGDGSNICSVLLAVDVLTELGIFKKENDSIILADTAAKVNLEDSQILKGLADYIERGEEND